MVPDVAGGLTEDKVQGKAFELVFAFDEVITTGGHKESITLQQASHYCCSSFNDKPAGGVVPVVFRMRPCRCFVLIETRVFIVFVPSPPFVEEGC